MNKLHTGRLLVAVIISPLSMGVSGGGAGCKAAKAQCPEGCCPGWMTGWLLRALYIYMALVYASCAEDCCFALTCQSFMSTGMSAKALRGSDYSDKLYNCCVSELKCCPIHNPIVTQMWLVPGFTIDCASAMFMCCHRIGNVDCVICSWCCFLPAWCSWNHWVCGHL